MATVAAVVASHTGGCIGAAICNGQLMVVVVVRVMVRVGEYTSSEDARALLFVAVGIGFVAIAVLLLPSLVVLLSLLPFLIFFVLLFVVVEPIKGIIVIVVVIIIHISQKVPASVAGAERNVASVLVFVLVLLFVVCCEAADAPAHELDAAHTLNKINPRGAQLLNKRCEERRRRRFLFAFVIIVFVTAGGVRGV